MPEVCYRPKTFTKAHEQVIERANQICAEYQEKGMTLTLRQIYYQFVSRGLMPNRQTEYDRLGSILNDARMAGRMDWDFMVDRTRNLVRMPHWKSPAELIKRAAEDEHTFHTDLWRGQHERVMVFVEKDAAIGVVESVCEANDVPYFSCRGYTSLSEVWSMAQRIRYFIECGDRVTILHIGDHDPSGVDMSRDLDERIRTIVVRDWLLTWGAAIPRPATVGKVKQSMCERMRAEGGLISDDQSPWRLKRIALNYDQIQRYQPPPNPVKTTDARHRRYTEDTGLDESWELDALDPEVLQNLIQDEIDDIRDPELWGQALRDMERDQATLRMLSQQWARVEEILQKGKTA